ncbi:MAG: exosome complex RNA-binding protein Rrp4 [Desulfurococcaceae archaeon]
MKIKPIVVERQIVRPGDLLGYVEGEQSVSFMLYPDKNVYVKENRVYSSVLGVVVIEDDGISVIPLEGFYIPKKDDLVIGTIVGIGLTSWIVDIRSPYKAVLNGSDVIEDFNPIQHDLRNYLDVGDQILARIVSCDRTRDPVLTIKSRELGKIIDGVIVEVKPSRVPRIIGRNKSMLNILLEYSGCNIIVAQNGLVWVRCSDKERYDAVINAIKMINDKPHMKGLTEAVKTYLQNRLGGR